MKPSTVQMSTTDVPYPPWTNNQPYFNTQRNLYYNDDSNRDRYYNLENAPKARNFSCKVCNKDFFSNRQLQKHVSEHVECPFPECKLKAHTKVIDQHISHQHMLINFEAIQIDDEAWIADRKKRFPSRQRADLRRVQQMERFKRGERLGKDGKKFGKGKFSSNASKSGEVKTPNIKREPRRSKFRPNKWDQPEVSNVVVDLYDSDSESKRGVPAFKGTKSFFESTGELSLFGLKNASISDRCSDIDISDEEEWSPPTSVSQPKKTILHNALGSLIGAYESESEVEDAPKTTELVSGNQDKNTSNNVVEVNNSNAIEAIGNDRSSNRRKRKRHTKTNKNEKEPWKRPNKRPTYSKRRRPTLLQKLLEPDITHERNVILQCIRYILDHDYFESNPSPQTDKQHCQNEIQSSPEVDQSKSSFEVVKQRRQDDVRSTPVDTSSLEEVISLSEVDKQHSQNELKSLSNVGKLIPNQSKSSCEEAEVDKQHSQEDVRSSPEVDGTIQDETTSSREVVKQHNQDVKSSSEVDQSIQSELKSSPDVDKPSQNEKPSSSIN